MFSDTQRILTKSVIGRPELKKNIYIYTKRLFFFFFEDKKVEIKIKADIKHNKKYTGF